MLVKAISEHHCPAKGLAKSDVSLRVYEGPRICLCNVRPEMEGNHSRFQLMHYSLP